MAQTEVLAVGPGTTLRVVAHDEQRLEFEASYAGGGTPPPAHLHPDQDEHFEVLAGAMRVRIAGRERQLAKGEVLDVPRGTADQMWNGGGEQAVMRWTTTPAGRTLDWFRELAAAMAGNTGGRSGDAARALQRRVPARRGLTSAERDRPRPQQLGIVAGDHGARPRLGARAAFRPMRPGRRSRRQRTGSAGRRASRRNAPTSTPSTSSPPTRTDWWPGVCPGVNSSSTEPSPSRSWSPSTSAIRRSSSA